MQSETDKRREREGVFVGRKSEWGAWQWQGTENHASTSASFAPHLLSSAGTFHCVCARVLFWTTRAIAERQQCALLPSETSSIDLSSHSSTLGGCYVPHQLHKPFHAAQMEGSFKKWRSTWYHVVSSKNAWLFCRVYA